MTAPRPIVRVLGRHVVSAAVVPLLVVELSLLLLYFVFGDQVAGRWREELLSRLRQELHRVSDARAKILDGELRGVMRQTEAMRQTTRLLLQRRVEPTGAWSRDGFVMAPNGALFQRENDGGASVFFSNRNEVEWEIIRRTEPLDELMRSVVDEHEIVVAAYVNTPSDFNRYYPFIEDAADQFPPDMNMEDYAFFYRADHQHNPERRTVWTEAYLDPAGAGWMVSAVAPVYRAEGALAAVVGLDVTVDKLAASALDLDLKSAAPALLVSADGAIIGLNHDAANRFPAGLKLLEAAPDGVKGDERRLEAEATLRTLLDDGEAAAILRKAWERPSGELDLRVGGEAYVVTHAEVPSTGWRLAVLVPRDDVVAPVAALEATTRNVGFAVVGAMALFYAGFFFVVYARSRRLANAVATPLEDLTRAARSGGDREALPPRCGLAEVDQLSESFGRMLGETDRYQRQIESINHGLATEVARATELARAQDRVLLSQAQRAAMGDMVASVAHHWRQPLTVLQLLIDEMRAEARKRSPGVPRGAPSAELDEMLGEAEATIESMNRTIDRFRAVYEDVGAEEVSVGEVVDRALDIADGALKERRLVVHREGTPTAETRRVSGSRELGQGLIQLLSVVWATLSSEVGPRDVRLHIDADGTWVRVSLEFKTTRRRASPLTIGAPRAEFPEEVALYASRGLLERLGGGVSVEDDGITCRIVVEVPARAAHRAA
ncbi:MAG: hypothetical protein AAF928_01205 [Myxococcota bacterium]